MSDWVRPLQPFVNGYTLAGGNGLLLAVTGGIGPSVRSEPQPYDWVS